MKAFMEEYGLSILIAIVSFVLIVMATPLRDVVRRGLGDTFTEFKTENIKYVNFCIHPNNGTTSNTTWCTQVPKDSLLKYIKQEGDVPKTQMFNVENEPINQKGEKVESADVSADVIGEFLTASGSSIKPTSGGKLELEGLRNTEFGTLSDGKIIPMTENKTFYAIWNGVAVGEQVDLKGFRKGGTVEINGILFDIARVDKDAKEALIISKNVYLWDNDDGKLKSTHKSNSEAVSGDDFKMFEDEVDGLDTALWRRITSEVSIKKIEVRKENNEYVEAHDFRYFYNPSAAEIKDLYDVNHKKIAYNGTIEMPYYTRTLANESTVSNTKWCIIDTEGQTDCSTGSKAGIRLTTWINLDELNTADYRIVE